MVESLRTRRLVRIASWSGAAFLCVVFLKNAWACDDAYISFRSIEQLFAGNGPRWNPHERVQVFTSPLWYWFLSAFRVASTDVFINAIIASGVSFVATLFVIRKVVRDEILWLAVMVLLVASNGFFDYTSSGLENPLCYLLLSLYLLYFFRLLEEGGDPQQKRSTARRLLFVVGLLLLCRYDLLTLVLAPTLYAIDRSRTLASKRGWLADVLVAFAPVLLWSVFALIYYGTIFPNPAYAKLWTGIAPVVLWQKGVYYLATVARYDPITVAVIVVGAGALLASRRNELRALGVGVFFNLFYIVSVGGDFMLGRFLSHAFLLTALALAVWMSRTPWMSRRVVAATLAVCTVYWFAWPHTPVNSPLLHTSEAPDQHGFADERGIYSRASLWSYFHQQGAPTFPDTQWALDGLALRESDICCSFNWSMGFYGYWAGTEKRIIDLFAVCDPFVARLPVTGSDWRIGHFPRALPEGYLETVHHGRNLIVDPRMREWYETVYLVTQSERLLAPARLRAIVAYNLPR